MIHFITGASGSGKTACLERLKQSLPKHAIYDFDEIGVPRNASKAWRQDATEQWLQRLIDEKQPACLLGLIVPGEIMACLSFKEMAEYNIVLLDCDDCERVVRLKTRDNFLLNQDTLNFSSWLRMHCQDPTWQPSVILDDASNHLNFAAFQSLTTWPITIESISTTNLSIDEVVSRLVMLIQFKEQPLSFALLNQEDIPIISAAFMNEAYHKPESLFEAYYQQQQQSLREVWLVKQDGKPIGYACILWRSAYPPFARDNIPEIQDLNILPSYQRQGIGRQFLSTLEQHVSKTHHTIGLGVGLTADYGPAQRLYSNQGYKSNKQGITYQYQAVTNDKHYPIDDDLLLWLTKSLNYEKNL